MEASECSAVVGSPFVFLMARAERAVAHRRALTVTLLLSERHRLDLTRENLVRRAAVLRLRPNQLMSEKPYQRLVSEIAFYYAWDGHLLRSQDYFVAWINAAGRR